MMARFDKISDEQLVEEARGVSAHANSALAEMMLRLKGQLKASADEEAKHARTLSKLTRVLVYLTFVIAGLTVVLVAVELLVVE